MRLLFVLVFLRIRPLVATPRPCCIHGSNWDGKKCVREGCITMQNGAPPWCRFRCPANSCMKREVKCLSGLHACECDAGFVKQDGRCEEVPNRISSGPAPGQPHFSFGIVADVQYADKPNKLLGGRERRYREAPGKLRAAIQHWKRSEPGLLFVLHLGDIIDSNKNKDAAMEDLERMASVFDTLEPLPVYHVIGNHGLTLPREKLVARLPSLKAHPEGYYSITIADGWQLVALDTNELSLYSGYDLDSCFGKEVQRYYDKHPPEENPQIQKFNGGISLSQMRWLEETLEQADSRSQSVIVAVHHGIESGLERLRAWNFREIATVLERHPSVKLVLTGHDHRGGYALKKGIHHVTLEGLVEAPENSNAFATVHIYSDEKEAEIEAYGVATSRVLKLT